MSGRQKPYLAVRTQKHHGLCDFQLPNISIISLACRQIEICRNVLKSPASHFLFVSYVGGMISMHGKPAEYSLSLQQFNFIKGFQKALRLCSVWAPSLQHS